MSTATSLPLTCTFFTALPAAKLLPVLGSINSRRRAWTSASVMAIGRLREIVWEMVGELLSLAKIRAFARFAAARRDARLLELRFPLPSTRFCGFANERRSARKADAAQAFRHDGAALCERAV